MPLCFNLLKMETQRHREHRAHFTGTISCPPNSLPNSKRLSAPAKRKLPFGIGDARLEREIMPMEQDDAVYPVWFGTNRQLNTHGDGFTGQRHHSVSRGRVEVFVPEAHRFGETGSSFWQKPKRFDLRDDSLRVQHVVRQDRDSFFAKIRNVLQLARDSGESQHALLFLHGFNVRFEEAAICTVQIRFDLKVPGATAFFSWPCRTSISTCWGTRISRRPRHCSTTSKTSCGTAPLPPNGNGLHPPCMEGRRFGNCGSRAIERKTLPFPYRVITVALCRKQLP